ncbi:MAG: isocitrate lyase/phosphoenolpyruvate mutase family protein [Actinobacteria bacterium]|nr:isocitrate lyase/phosphoenolpyruvate mutase family protein [Actinomycetota bacterium]
MTTSDALRARLANGESVLMPGVWDPLSALLAERAGFSTVFLSGFAVAGTMLGVPDIGILGQQDVADTARRVCAAVPAVSVVVDADTGYGDDEVVAQTTALWEEANAAAMFLEDQVWPKRCGHMDGKEVVEPAEWLHKLQIVLRERDDLFLTARTDARAVNGLHDAIERAKMSRDIGADAVFVEAPQSVEEMQQIADALPDVVLVANMVEKGKTPLLTPSELAELGFRMIVSPLSGLLAVSKALGDAYGVLQEQGSMRDHQDLLTPFNDFTDIVGLPKYLADDIASR